MRISRPGEPSLIRVARYADGNAVGLTSFLFETYTPTVLSSAYMFFYLLFFQKMLIIILVVLQNYTINYSKTNKKYSKKLVGFRRSGAPLRRNPRPAGEDPSFSRGVVADGVADEGDQ